MKNKNQPFETGHDLTGHASVDFAGRDTFSSFAARIAGYSEERFSPVALRVFIQKGEPVVTLFAADNTKKSEDGKLAVKKFKIRMTFEEFVSTVKKFDFTVSDGKNDISEMVVINK